MDPPPSNLKQSIKGDHYHSLADKCMYSEPIWNSQFQNSFTMCKAVYAVIWCWALGEVCHTFITYENEAIYVNIKFLLVLCKVKIPFWWAHLMSSSSNFQMTSSQITPPAKQCLKWESIWNHHTALHCIQLYMLSFGVQLLNRSVIYLLLQKMH